MLYFTSDMVYFISTGGELATEEVQESDDRSCYIIQFVSPEGSYLLLSHIWDDIFCISPKSAYAISSFQPAIITGSLAFEPREVIIPSMRR